jgi:dCMP deaminase
MKKIDVDFDGIGRDILKRDVFMKTAIQISRLGTCPRKAVGAVLIRDGRCISWGFNGAPPGLPHCEQNNHGWQMKPEFREQYADNPEDAEQLENDMLTEQGCRNATHAEANALAFAAKQGISTDNSELFVTVAPCDVCAKLLIAAGVRRVYFEEDYRDPAGIELLKLAGIGCVLQEWATYE